MAVKSLIDRFRKRAREANKSARQLAIDVVSGKKIADDTILEACRVAGLQPEQFAKSVEAMDARKQAIEAYRKLDYPGQLTAIRAERTQIEADLRAIGAELAALRAESERLNERDRYLMSHYGVMSSKGVKALHEFEAVYGDPATADWRNEPTPKVRRGPSIHGPAVNVGWQPQPGSMASGNQPESQGTSSKRIDFGKAVDVGGRRRRRNSEED